MLDTKGNRITYFGHSTFSVTTRAGQVVLIDPWVMMNPMGKGIGEGRRVRSDDDPFVPFELDR